MNLQTGGTASSWGDRQRGETSNNKETPGFSGVSLFSVHIHEPEQTPHSPHHGVTEICLQELVRARAWYDCNAVGFALFHRVCRNAGHTCHQTGLGAHHAVHPDMLDAEVHALLDNLIGYLWTGKDEDRIHFLGDGFQIRVAGITIERGDARVHSKHFVAIILELGVSHVAACFAFIGNTYHRDLLLREKILYHVIDLCHEITPLLIFS